MEYASVDRYVKGRDMRGKVPDHLSLPKYDDSFIKVDNSCELVRILKKGQSTASLNDLRWQTTLRNANRSVSTQQITRSGDPDTTRFGSTEKKQRTNLN